LLLFLISLLPLAELSLIVKHGPVMIGFY